MDSGDNKKKENGVKFRKFDIASDYSDHFYGTSGKHSKIINNKPAYKTIMKEWRILEEHLPDSIFVRVYEERIDLVRAAITGPSGTPYHDGLFFFDIALPSSYPHNPPLVYYHSHGYRINPNLYANGYVCLSLINTWFGKKKEKWSQKSTLLQLLISLQGLVLNDQPYFNEPGAVKFGNGHDSAVYNVRIFNYSCHTMICTMNKPPKNFECLVGQHFRARGDYILECFKAYCNGQVTIGRYKNDMCSSSSSSSLSTPYVVRKAFTKEEKKLFDLLQKWFDYIKKSNYDESSANAVSLTRDKKSKYDGFKETGDGVQVVKGVESSSANAKSLTHDKKSKYGISRSFSALKKLKDGILKRVKKRLVKSKSS